MARRTSVPGKLAKDIGKASKRNVLDAVGELAGQLGKIAALSQATNDRLDYAEDRLAKLERQAQSGGAWAAGAPKPALRLGQWRADEVMPPTETELALARSIGAQTCPMTAVEASWLEWIEARKEQAKRAAR